jgi:hypothetical protein
MFADAGGGIVEACMNCHEPYRDSGRRMAAEVRGGSF